MSRVVNKPNQGFTIVELLIATLVFSVVLMLSLAGFLQIGKVFYKGVSVTSTQDAANQIVQDISGELQGASSFLRFPQSGDVLPTSPQTSYAYYCVGNNRYTYIVNHVVNSSNPQNLATASNGGNFGILKDILPGGANSCGTPCTPASCAATPGGVAFQSPIELLGDNMRLNAFYINQVPNTSLYNIKLELSYGDDSVFDNLLDPNTIVCKGDSNIDQFCSVNLLNTAVYRGFNQ